MQEPERSNRTPLVTKESGIRKPNPIASTFGQNDEAGFSRSARRRSPSTMPARTAPRIDSRPNRCDITRNTNRISSARRMRICTVPPSSFSNCGGETGAVLHPSQDDPQQDGDTAYATMTSRLSSTPDSPSPKNRDSSSTADNSATVATMRIVWPAGVVVSLASRRIGMTTPRPVAERITAISDGVSTTSAAPRTDATPKARTRLIP